MRTSIVCGNETISLTTDRDLRQLEFIAAGGKLVAATVDEQRRAARLLMLYDAVGRWPLTTVDTWAEIDAEQMGLAILLGPACQHVAYDH